MEKLNPVKTNLGWINKPIPVFSKEGVPTVYDIMHEGVLAVWDYLKTDRGMGQGLVLQSQCGEFWAFDKEGVKAIGCRNPEPITTENTMITKQFLPNGFQSGDFVKCRLTGFCFILLTPAAMPFGKGRSIAGWKVRNASGREDWVSEEDIVLVNRNGVPNNG